MFLEKYNCLIIEKNMSNFNDNIEIYYGDYYSEDSDEEYSDEKVQRKKIRCMDLFLEKIRTKIIRSFFELGTLKFPPEI